MNRLKLKNIQANRRSHRVGSRIFGTSKVPRLSVKVTNRQIIAQLVDDQKSETLVYSSALKKAGTTMTDLAKTVGADVAKKAKQRKITVAVFDRGAKKYHGRVKALADSARENGLEI